MKFTFDYPASRFLLVVGADGVKLFTKNLEISTSEYQERNPSNIILHISRANEIFQIIDARLLKAYPKGEKAVMEILKEDGRIICNKKWKVAKGEEV